MALWKARTLDNLGRIFRFAAGETLVQRMDLTAPVQPVVDISRLAEKGTGVGDETGFFFAEMNEPAASASTFYGTLNLYDLLGSGGFQLIDVERDYRIWIMRVGAYCNSTGMPDVTRWAVNVSCDHTKMRLNTSSEDPVFFLAGGLGQPGLFYPKARSFDTTIWDMMGTNTVDGEGLCHTTRLPMYLPPPASLQYSISVTSSLAPNGFMVVAQCWAGVKGSSPPGLS